MNAAGSSSDRPSRGDDDHRSGRGLAPLALWSLVAIGYAVALALSEDWTWFQAVGVGLSSTAPAVLLGAGVDRFAERWPLSARRDAALIHALAAATFAAVWSAAIITEVSIFAPRRAVANFLRDGLVWQFVMGIIVYAVLVGLVSVRLGRRREREQASSLERSETLRLRAELNALRARLDPHFLFNTLQMLGALVTDHPADAHRALELLALLLRRRLDHLGEDSDLATFAEELADARDYLALEALSLGERLTVVEDISPGTLRMLLPRFSMQPLVENAIRHGIGPRKSGGRITIRAATATGSTWMFEIADDGVGSALKPPAVGRGIGVATVEERIRIHFGGRASMRVNTAPGLGYGIIVELPVSADDD